MLWVAFILAIKQGNVGKVTSMLEEDKSNVSIRDSDGNTPLHWAVFTANSKNHSRIAEILLENGAEIEAKNEEEEQVPLHWAAISGNALGINVLLDHGADLMSRDTRGYNALQHAVQYNETLVAYFLIRKGINVDCRDDQGHTPLHWASYLGHENTMRMLINSRAQLDAQDDKGMTSLHWAASKAQKRALNILLEAGADARILDNDGNTPVDSAQKKGYFALVYLIKKKYIFYSHYKTESGVSN